MVFMLKNITLYLPLHTANATSVHAASGAGSLPAQVLSITC
jgi:hypothetical protein